MDPDACLEEMRRLVASIQNDDDDCNADALKADRLAELGQSLDGWMSQGGFPPKAWYGYGDGK